MANNIKINQTHEKEIIALDAFESVRLRPGMYVGQVQLAEDKLPIIIENQIYLVDKKWSAGFMQLFIEIIENGIDEAKRCKGKMKNLNVSVNLDTNEVIVRDEGNGFHNAAKKHSKTKKNVVRTALEDLHAGSNFSDNDKSILGTNGVGAAVVNILSSDFKVTTINNTDYVSFTWKDYKISNEEIRPKKSTDKLGTTISFIPTPDVFGKAKWDIDLVNTYLSYKAFLIKNDPLIGSLKITGTFIKGDKEFDIDICQKFIPDNAININTKLGNLILWRSYENSSSLSFVNGSQCSGIHQKIVQDWINEFFKYNLAHHFYETMIILNVPSKLMRFGDQNKTKYTIVRQEIEEELNKAFKTKILSNLKSSDIAREIEKDIENRLYEENIKKIRRTQKTSKSKISEKYSPSSKEKVNIFLTEGLSAAGSLRQARDSEKDAIYALKGKIKNSRKLSDLSENVELLEIISILGLDPTNKNTSTPFKKIIIAADMDPDGEHITALISNFFHKWFPNVINEHKLFRLLTPLVACNDGSKRRYFYALDEFEKEQQTKKLTNINYLKGLGSLSIEDWENVMENKVMFSILNDAQADKYLDIAFGDSSFKRKKWLSA